MTLAPEPLYTLGEVLWNGATVTEHSFEVHSDGSTSERHIDSNGQGSLAHRTPDQHYRPRHSPTFPTWPDPDLSVFVFHLYRFPVAMRPLPPSAVWVWTGATEWEYFEHLTALFDQCRGPFAVVNQDIVYRPDIDQAFRDCPEPWCRYRLADFPDAPVTGCTRYRPEIVPDASRILHALRGPQRTWMVCGEYLTHQLEQAGHRCHYHSPPVIHLGPGGHMPENEQDKAGEATSEGPSSAPPEVPRRFTTMPERAVRDDLETR